MRRLLHLVDALFGWHLRKSGAVGAGEGAAVVWRRIRQVAGNRLSIALDRSTYQRRYEFSFMNPYFTDSGLSLGYNVWWREFDYSSFNVASYSSNSGAFQVLLGIPLSESNSISLMAGVDSNQINAFAGSTPDPLMDYLYAVGDRTFRSFRIQGAWARDTRNNYLMPTIGSTHNLSAQIVLPGSTISYYKLQYDFTRYWPLNPSIVLKTATTLGFGDSSTGWAVLGAPPTARRFFFSTSTDLERPWLKLWRTCPDSTVRRTLSVIFLEPRAVLSSVSLISLIPCPYPIQQASR